MRMLNEEYGFAMDDMVRDFNIAYEDMDTGKNKKLKADLVVFNKEKEHIQDNIIRLCIIHDEKVKDSHNKKGVEASVKTVLWDIENCEFALWSNGLEYHYIQKVGKYSDKKSVYSNSSQTTIFRDGHASNLKYNFKFFLLGNLLFITNSFYRKN
nr:hypothetical protein [Draconibacterium sediminis]